MNRSLTLNIGRLTRVTYKHGLDESLPDAWPSKTVHLVSSIISLGNTYLRRGRGVVQRCRCRDSNA